MAIIRRGRIVFDFKVVLTGPEYDDFVKDLVRMSKKAAQGVKLPKRDLALVSEAYHNGPEAALVLAIKSGASSFIRTEFTETGLSVGNVAVRL